MTSTGGPTLLHTRPPPPHSTAPPPPPPGRCRHTPGQRDAGRLLPCALPGESVSGNFSRRHVLGAFTTTTTTTYHTIPYHTIPYHTIPYHTIPYHTIPYHTIPYHTLPYHTIPYHTHHTIPYHTIPYHTIPYHTIPYHTIPYHTIPYHIAGPPPANPRFFLEGAHEPRGRHRVYTAMPDGAPTGNPPPRMGGCTP